MKKKQKLTREDQRRELNRTTANEFINVRDIRGNFLYGKDGMVFCYLKIHPVSLDLLSTAEKVKKIKTFSSEFSSERKEFKFFSISRPVDISNLTNSLTGTMMNASDPTQKDLLRQEVKEISGFALNGEVIERQFFMVLWESASEDAEGELLKRLVELESKFRNCEITVELADQSMMIQLCNLFTNPAYVHLEDSDYEPEVPFLKIM